MFFSCNDKHSTSNEKTEIIENNIIRNEKKCDEKIPEITKKKTDISFCPQEKDFSQNSEFIKYSNDSVRLKIKSIKISQFDDIPIELKIFKNVETVLIHLCDSINLDNLNIFPNLKTIQFMGCHIELYKKYKWLDKIEVLYAEKLYLTGLRKLSNMPNLRSLILRYTSFKSTNMDFNNLPYLQNLKINGYMRDTLDLRKINLNKLKCLKNIEITDVYGVIKGIPKNLQYSNVEQVYIKNNYLTKTEKEILTKIKSAGNNK